MTDLSATETKAEYEEQKRIVRELHDRLVDTEFQLSEGEKLRRKLHNTILVIMFSSLLDQCLWVSLVLNSLLLQELKGNIRVFCRVRPLLPDDGVATEAALISYPTSTEALGRGIDLMQSGMAISVMPMAFDIGLFNGIWYAHLHVYRLH